MCGYMIEEDKIPMLKQMGAKDSKQLTARRRAYLFSHLEKAAYDLVVLKLSAYQIDKLRNVANLNRLEIEKMAEIINLLEPDKVILDSIEANTERFRAKVKAKLDNKNIEIISENFADRKYPIVGAASIIAKYHRDGDIKKLHKRYGKFGSGYPSDPITINFLKKWLEKNKDFPPCVRRSWLTAITIKNNKEQKHLSMFDKK